MTSQGQTSNSLPFTVNAIPPTLTSIAPNNGNQGQSGLAVTLTGTNFAAGSTISPLAGVTITNTSVVNSTTITANFAIAGNAPLGPQSVTVTSNGQTSNAVPFTVNPILPTLTSIAPNNGNQGSGVAVTLTGTNFAAGSTINPLAGVTITNTSVVNSTTITANFAIAGNAPLGPQSVTVTSNGQTSNAVSFTVNLAPPTLALIAPNNGLQGQTLPVTLTGTNFVAGAVISPITGVTITNTTVVNSTTITATFAIAAGAPLGTQNVTVTTAGGTSNAQGFTINSSLPTVIATTPLAGATGVPANNKIIARFNKPMNPATINVATFLVNAVAPISGPISTISVFYDSVNNVAIFTPQVNLPTNNSFTATVTVGAMDTATPANPLVLGPPGPVPNPWTFTTGGTDFSQPVVVATNPPNGAVNVPLNQVVTATFSKQMDSTSLNTTTFTLSQGGTPIVGVVTYQGFTASFTPNAPLSPTLLYTATIQGGLTGARDLGGNQLSGAPATWTFTTGPPFVTPNRLGRAATFGAFGGNAGVTSSGLLTVVNGDLGTTAASTLITGFHDTTLVGPPPPCTYTETTLNNGTVNGTIFTAPPPPSGACPNEGTAATLLIAQRALADANTAFTALSAANLPGGANPGAQLGGLTLAPGIYTAPGGTFLLTGSDLTLDAQGNPDAVWVFQMGSSLTVGAPGFPRSVILLNGALPKNVFWQVGSAATINPGGGGTMVGTIIASSGVQISTAGTPPITTLNGRALGLNASVTMVNTVINVPAP